MVRRPSVYFDPDVYPEWLPLTFTPSPELYRAFGGDLDALVHHMGKLAEGAVGALREARKGRPVIGAAALRRIHPWKEPRTMREPGGDRVPTFKHGARGLTAKQWDIAGALDTKRFRGEHHEARLERLAGGPAVFPYGTYLMRVQHGAEVAEPHGDALVTAPGRTLDEVKELANGAGPRARELELSPIRDAFRDEAGDIVEVLRDLRRGPRRRAPTHLREHRRAREPLRPARRGGFVRLLRARSAADGRFDGAGRGSAVARAASSHPLRLHDVSVLREGAPAALARAEHLGRIPPTSPGPAKGRSQPPPKPSTSDGSRRYPIRARRPVPPRAVGRSKDTGTGLACGMDHAAAQSG